MGGQARCSHCCSGELSGGCRYVGGASFLPAHHGFLNVETKYFGSTRTLQINSTRSIRSSKRQRRLKRQEWSVRLRHPLQLVFERRCGHCRTSPYSLYVSHFPDKSIPNACISISRRILGANGGNLRGKVHQALFPQCRGSLLDQLFPMLYKADLQTSRRRRRDEL